MNYLDFDFKMVQKRNGKNSHFDQSKINGQKLSFTTVWPPSKKSLKKKYYSQDFLHLWAALWSLWEAREGAKEEAHHK